MDKYTMMIAYEGKKAIIVSVQNLDPDTAEPILPREWVKHSDAMAEIASLMDKLNIQETKDLVWITRDEIKELQDNRETIAELKELLATTEELKIKWKKIAFESQADAIEKMADKWEKGLEHIDVGKSEVTTAIKMARFETEQLRH